MEKQSPPQLVAGKVATISSVVIEGLLTEQQAADLLGLAVGTLRNDRTTADLGLPYCKIAGRAVRYRASDIRAFVEARMVRPGAAKQ